MRMLKNIKLGDLIELGWLDAIYFCDWDDKTESAVEHGGELCISTGVMVKKTNKIIVLATELNSARQAQRDFNLIPICLIKHIKLIKRGYSEPA